MASAQRDRDEAGGDVEIIHFGHAMMHGVSVCPVYPVYPVCPVCSVSTCVPKNFGGFNLSNPFSLSNQVNLSSDQDAFPS